MAKELKMTPEQERRLEELRNRGLADIKSSEIVELQQLKALEEEVQAIEAEKKAQAEAERVAKEQAAREKAEADALNVAANADLDTILPKDHFASLMRLARDNRNQLERNRRGMVGLLALVIFLMIGGLAVMTLGDSRVATVKDMATLTEQNHQLSTQVHRLAIGVDALKASPAATGAAYYEGQIIHVNCKNSTVVPVDDENISAYCKVDAPPRREADAAPRRGF